MNAVLLLALLVPQKLEVEGLAHGERFEVLPAVAAPIPELDRYDEGRVVDARTGFPVAGAQLEAWTEEISEPGAGFRRVGEATTGPDGLFRLRVVEGALRGDKLRVRAAGYLTLSTTAGDQLLQLMPVQGEPPLLRVVDLHDRPIPGARITSTYSCSHDLPAFEVRTDAFGIARLPEWGLQDQTPELRVRAEGHGAIEYLGEHEVLADLQMLHEREVPIVRLGRRRALRAIVLDGEGRPLVAAPLHVVDGEGYHVPFTDEQGRFEVLAPYGGTEVTLYALLDGKSRFIFAGRLPEAEDVRLRLESSFLPDDEPLVDVVVRVEPVGGDAGPPDLQIFHESGWTDEPRWEGAAATGCLPPGNAVLLVGGAFSGWEELLLELELVEGRPAAVQLAPRREPELKVLTPPEEAHLLVVEAGNDSIEVEPEKSGQTTLSVPAGRPVTVLSHGERSRRLVLPPLEADATADLRGDSGLLPRSVAQRREELERTTLRVRVLWDGGPNMGEHPLAGELAAHGNGEPTVESLARGEWLVESAAGSPVLVHHRAQGYADCWTSAHAPLPDGPQPEILLFPTPLASVRIVSELDFEVEGPLAGNVVKGPREAERQAFHPGPLTLTLRLGDGRRVALDLLLEPRAHRILGLR